MDPLVGGLESGHPSMAAWGASVGDKHIERRILWMVGSVAFLLYIAGIGHPDARVGGEGAYPPYAQGWLEGQSWLDENGLPTNNEHPPLSKLLLFGTMAVLGDQPIAWRLPAVVAGVATVCTLFLFASRLAGSHWVGGLAALLLILDNHHYVASTNFVFPDTIALAFILAALARLLAVPPDKWTAPVLLGLGIATKLTALFVAPVFVWLWIRQFGPPGQRVRIGRLAFLALTILGTLLFTYLPFIAAWATRGGAAFAATELPRAIIQMVTFHGAFQNVEGHAISFTTLPFEWFIFSRPNRFFWDELPTGLVAGIWTLGNPMVWWGGPLFALAAAAWKRVRPAVNFAPGLGTAAALLAVQWAPFFFMGRKLFAYYMVAVVPYFAVLAAIPLAALLARRKGRPLVGLVVALALVVFVIRFPLSEAWPVTPEYIRVVAPTAPFRFPR